MLTSYVDKAILLIHVNVIFVNDIMYDFIVLLHHIKVLHALQIL